MTGSTFPLVEITLAMSSRVTSSVLTGTTLLRRRIQPVKSSTAAAAITTTVINRLRSEPFCRCFAKVQNQKFSITKRIESGC